MPLVPNPAAIEWVTGSAVDAQKAMIRETDSMNLMKLLLRAFSQGGPLEQTALNIQVICDQARVIVQGGVPANPVMVGPDMLWRGYDDAVAIGAPGYFFTQNVRALADIRVMQNQTLVNALAIGDFCRSFADLITSAGATCAAGLQPFKVLIQSLQNPEAFNKTTNRTRVKRRDILDQVAPVGTTQWYLPPDDVLGTIDRLLGYYETGDISGTTTDSLAVLAILHELVAAGPALDFPAVPAVEARIVAMVNNGLAFCSFAGMVIQMHHSLPECMMAINLMPRTIGGNNIVQIYSPLLTNTGLNDIGVIYADWQQARFSALGGAGQIPANTQRMLVVVQDIFQMPNRATDVNEVAFIIPLTYAGMTNNATVFGVDFYNNVVATLNTSNPGPAITLEKLSASVFNMWFGPVFNPAVADPPFTRHVVDAVQKGMELPDGTIALPALYRDLTTPFIGPAVYGHVQPAIVP